MLKKRKRVGSGRDGGGGESIRECMEVKKRNLNGGGMRRMKMEV
jgi:hypothetical protein